MQLITIGNNYTSASLFLIFIYKKLIIRIKPQKQKTFVFNISVFKRLTKLINFDLFLISYQGLVKIKITTYFITWQWVNFYSKILTLATPSPLLIFIFY